MNIEDLVNTFKTNPIEENCIKLLEWCYKNDANFNDANNRYAYEKATHYLLLCKIGKWNKEDAKIIIKSFANIYAYRFQLTNEMKLEILDNETYDKKFTPDSYGTCIDKKNICEVFYSESLVDELVSNDANRFLNALQIIVHEVVHVLQNNTIKGDRKYTEAIDHTKSIYIMSVESIIRRVDKKFYTKNYDQLYKENHAQKEGLKKAIEIVKSFNPKILNMYNQDKINGMIDKYENSMDSVLTVHEQENTHMKVMNPILYSYVQNHLECLNEFPSLKIAFNPDGTKKNIIQLIMERKQKIPNCDDKEKLDQLYLMVCNDKDYTDENINEEIKNLYDFLSKNDYDEFEYELFVYRLNKANLTPERKEEILNSIRKDTIVEEKKIS